MDCWIDTVCIERAKWYTCVCERSSYARESRQASKHTAYTYICMYCICMSTNWMLSRCCCCSAVITVNVCECMSDLNEPPIHNIAWVGRSFTFVQLLLCIHNTQHSTTHTELNCCCCSIWMACTLSHTIHKTVRQLASMYFMHTRDVCRNRTTTTAAIHAHCTQGASALALTATAECARVLLLVLFYVRCFVYAVSGVFCINGYIPVTCVNFMRLCCTNRRIVIMHTI